MIVPWVTDPVAIRTIHELDAFASGDQVLMWWGDNPMSIAYTYIVNPDVFRFAAQYMVCVAWRRLPGWRPTNDYDPREFT